MFYDQFAMLCDEHNIKQTTLARKLGFSSSAVSYWRKGSIPQSDTVKKIADYFGVSVDFLLGTDDGSGAAKIYSSSGAQNSVVLQGTTGNNTVSNGATGTEIQLSEPEEEVLRIFRALDMRRKNAVMTYLYDLEDQINK